MKLDAKVKGGLAWAGLVVILAVPAADILFGKSDGTSASAAVTADAQAGKPAIKLPALAAPAKTDPIETASVTSEDPVDKLLAKGKKLPSYISDAEEGEVATKPPVQMKPIAPAAQPAKTPTEVASVAPAETPPTPLPRSARPKTTEVASLPAEEKPLVLNENKVRQQQNAAVEPFPLSDNEVVTGDQLEEWDSGSLADYLERKGLLSEANSQTSDRYDPDGFFLDEGPNRPRRQDDPDFFLF